jgi:hypothetical protein
MVVVVVEVECVGEQTFIGLAIKIVIPFRVAVITQIYLTCANKMNIHLNNLLLGINYANHSEQLNRKCQQ